MPFDIGNLNAPVKFYYGKGKKEWVELRNIPLSEVRKIKETCVTTEVEYWRPDGSSERPHRYEVDKSDIQKLDSMLWDYQIADWCLLDNDGNAIDCTLENKLLLMGHSTEFLEWVLDCLKTLAEDEQKSKEDSEKN
jgi:hypothetical protein